MGTLLEQDKYRYAVEKMPRFQRLFRCCQECRFKPMQLVYRLLFRWCRQRNFIELSHQTVIGGGLISDILIASPSILKPLLGGMSISIEGLLLARRIVKRKGAPTLGDDIWIGINASIVGGVKVGNDVMIAPGAFVNRDVPSHSVVIGNPCIIKHKDHATEGYINHKSQ